ncbi:tRNA pseudouridine(55) synthase TruB [Paramaledivibacter caminithermalis]|jgi:tRNA pseudouridine55 synthase|uniref:tRNA pseudouridine synthase B n=1 Tax=Paramaledivibacter caminithermalis (strain DSM 15212 / CIP 107654 / DViRD3) TaxID=1121301 RepID=A0A1M6N575_PARC5|nr:tRNA pseudouridine(55) synthase TruB [Paramaledivibacter caminithermalis]SHJ90851.1 tRNA pseudouridine synthase B [Paramaledivibacter caminithermalis DSM 15212]
MKGILNIAKPPNMTSHDVVSFVRKKINLKKVGHTGTLDPMATGVLPICIGKATKVIQYMENDTKVYRAELTLGAVTDTQDKWGNIISQNNTNVSKKEILEAFNSFEGEIFQIPPMYSALKYKGKKLYELAREGKEIKREARRVYIYYINIINIVENRVLFDVKCSKGTYIRTLCHDIGKNLGVGGHMSFLARLQSGVFKLEDSVTIEELDEADIDTINKRYLYKIDYPLSDMPRIDIALSAAKSTLNGVPVKENFYKTNSIIKNNQLVRLYIEEKFIGIGMYNKRKNNSFIKIKKLFI